MKNPIYNRCTLATFLALALSGIIGRPLLAQSVWSGASGTDLNWSTAANWSPSGAPGPASAVFFGNTAAGASPLTNSFVDMNFTISSLAYTNSAASPGNYEGTVISGGSTLLVTNGFTVGGSNATTFANNVLITGPGALVVSNNNFLVQQGSSGDGVHQAVLDLSGLNTFQAVVNRFGVGFYSINNASRACGLLYLARTNLITVANTGTTNTFVVGWNVNSGGNSANNKGSAIYLGQTNAIFADSISVGSVKSAGQTGGAQTTGGLLAFNTNGLNNPSALFRNKDGISRVSSWQIGDDSALNNSNQGASGTNDFSGGSIDAMINNLNLGLSGTGASGGLTANGNGTLIFGAGTIDANNLTNGWSKGSGTSGNAGTGTINLNGPGTLKVNNVLNLASTNGATGAPVPAGTLNVGNATLIAGTIIAGGGNSTINLVGGTLIMTNGAASAGTLVNPISNFSVSNSVLNLAIGTGITPIVANNLTVNAPATINIPALPVIGTYPAQIPLIQYTSESGDLMTFSLGSLPTVAAVPYKGYLSNNVNNLSLDLVITNGFVPVGVDIWSGTNSANWDLASPNWLLFGSATTFVNGANAQFDDTAAGTTSVNLVGNLTPGSLVVSNNAKTYTFGGPGNIGGTASLVKNGSGTMILTNGGNNNFAGGILISNGTVQFGNGGTGGNLPASIPAIVDNGTLVLNQSSNVTLTNNLTGSGNFVQAGGGIVSLVGSNSYNGQTLATAGGLMIDGYVGGLAASLLTNSPGAVIGGNGTNLGLFNAGGIINPGDANSIGTFTTANGLALFPGASLTFDLNNNDATEGNGINDLIQVSGDLTANNTTVAINLQGGLPQAGLSYPVITYSGILHGSFNPVVKSHFAATVDTSTPNQVNVTITGTNGATLKWNSTGSSTWDMGATANWFNFGTASADIFGAGDSVLFDDSVAGVQTNITIPTGVAVYPVAITNISSANSFTLNGGGTISGPTALIKDGASTLTINTTNSFTGGVIIVNGTLRTGSGTALGLNNTASVTNIIGSGATLDLNAQSLGSATFVVSGSGVGGNGALINSGAAQLNAFQNIVLAGDTTFGGPGNAAGGGNTQGRWDIRGGTPSLTCLNGNPYNLTKTGSNQVTLVGVTVDQNLANITVKGGVFGIQGSVTSLGNPTNVLALYDNGTLLHCAGFSTALSKVIVMTNASVDCTGTGANEFDGPVTLQGTNTFSLTDPLTFTGVFAGSGGFTKLGASTLTLSASNTYIGGTIVSAGTLVLTEPGSITASTNIFVATGATIDVNGRADQTLTLMNGQTLGGGGNFNGSLTNNPGSVFFVGGNRLIGTNIVSGNATLEGSTFMDITNNGAKFDVLSAASITYGGILVVSNLDGANPLAANESFQLFNAGSYSGAFANILPANPGPGLAWDTNSLATSGTLNIVSAPVQSQPHIASVTLSGMNLIFSGTNGTAGVQYEVLTSTNLALPLNQWITNATLQFDVSGNFAFTNTVSPGTPQLFFQLKSP